MDTSREWMNCDVLPYSPIVKLLSFLLVVAITYYWTWTRSRTVRLVNALPGPPTLTLLGNFLQMNANNREDMLKVVHLKWTKEVSSSRQFNLMFK